MSPLNEYAVHPDVEKMPVPERIQGDPERMALWNFVCSDLANRDLLSPTYAITIQEIVESAILIQKCRNQVDKEGLTQPRYSKTGNLVGFMSHPLLGVISTHQRSVLKLIQMLGMSPRDIHYLVNPEATPTQVIEGQVKELQKIVYFRGDTSNG